VVNIIILESDAELCRLMTDAMSELGYEPIAVNSRDDAIAQLDVSPTALIVADMSCGGCELCAELRLAGIDVPVIVITNEPSRHEKRVIFRSGADGYMFPPVDMEELQMRVKNLLWRCHIVDSAMLCVGSCKLIAEENSVETPQGRIELRHMEFMLLQKLLSYPGHVYSRGKLMDEVWGYDSESDPRTVDTHVRRLRQKLKGVEDIRIQTVRGLGYRCVLPTSTKKY